MFLTATEWKELGGKKADSTNKAYRPLPFDSCALSLQPFEVRILLLPVRGMCGNCNAADS